MIFAIDCDGTFTRYPEIFVAIGKALMAAGHHVIMLTGNKLETMLTDRAVKYPLLTFEPWFDEMVTWDDSNDSERAALHDPENKLGARGVVAIFKQRICAERGVAVLFDDDVEHLRQVGNTPVFGVS